MKKVVFGLIIIVLVGAVVFYLRGGGPSYREVITLKKGDITVRLLSSDGKIKSGGNRIRVEVEPPVPLREFYFYMPPMPGMDEMRDVASLEEVEEGIYEGTLNISMDGPWQIRAVFENTMVAEDVFVPLSKRATASGGGGAMAHGGHIMVKKEKLQLLGVITEPVQRRNLVKTFSTVGYIDYDLSKIYEITVRADAWVEDTFGRFEGEYVKEGTPLMRVLSPEIQIALDEFRLAKEKEDPLLIRKAKEKLEYLKIKEIIKAPVSGVIRDMRVFEGGYVKEGETAFTIADLSSVWIVAEVPFKQGRYIGPGTKAVVVPEDSPDMRIEGVVDYIFPEANKMARTLRVRIRAKNRGIALKPGGLAEVHFRVPLGEVIAVPESAVVDTGRRQLVFVEMEEGMYMPVNIHVGRKADGYYEVHGLREGAKVVVRGTFLLDSEAQIRGIYGGGGGGGHHH